MERVEELDDDTVEALREQMSDDRFCLVAVDLSAPDKVIKDEIDKLVKDHRWDHKVIRVTMTEDDIKTWTACRVIAYIDIQLYERARGMTFRPAAIQSALFGDLEIEQKGREPKNILEQSTRKYADRLMADWYFERIAAQFGDVKGP